jgi:alkanesulfonate monooxygenase SsuD/methylene tetrahydromethanopterin reductase-like flavin-dependent oxidoreductase (luciferase family)
VEIVRAALARQGPLVYAGREYRIPLEGGTGLGKPLKLLARPVQARIPVYLGAIGPKAVEQVGEIADGWLPFMFDPRDPELLLAPLRRGAERAGRSLEEIDVAACVPIGLAGDVAVACTPAELDGRLAAYADAGVDTLVAIPCGPDREAIVRALAP